MLLNELFNSKTRLDQSEQDLDVQYKGQLSDGSYITINFMYMMDDEYEMTFAIGKQANFSDARFDKTGTRGEAPPTDVFGVVTQAMTRFIQQKRPSLIQFTADKTPSGDDNRKLSRTSLYARMLGRVNDPNYVVKTRQYSGFDEYQIVRKNTSSHKRADQFDKDFENIAGNQNAAD